MQCNALQIDSWFLVMGAIADILGLLILSIPILFWLGLFLYFARLLSKWKLKDIRKNYSDYFFGIGVLLFFGLPAFIFYLFVS